MNGTSLLAPAVLLAVCSGAEATVFPSGAPAGFEPVPFGSEQDACLHQVYAASLFSGASGGNSVRITAIALAPSLNQTYAAVMGIRLGYTNAVPGASGLSGLQSPASLTGGGAPNAVGSMTTFVPTGSGSRTFTSASPSNFQMTFSGQPFSYDPSQGNLLVEIVTSVHGGFPAYNEPLPYAAGGSDASLANNSPRFGAAAVPTQALRMDFTFTAVATGACCFGDGSCQFIASQHCTVQGGVYSGSGVTCAQANCPQPGACCMPDGSCAFEFAAACTAAGGVYAGANIPCSQANCPQPGACCTTSGACTFELPAPCAAAGGIFEGAGVTCAQASCPQPGACCLSDGTCSILLPAPCAAQSGTWRGVPTCAAAGCSSCFVVNGGFESGALLPGWGASIPQLWGVSAVPLPGGLSPHSGTYAAYFDGPSNNYNSDLSQVVPVRAGSRVTVSFWRAVGNSAELTVILDDQVLLGLAGPTSGWVYYQRDVTVLHDNPQLVFRVFAIPITPESVAWFDDVSICAACYPNCDGSTIPPVLNVNDFACFLNAYAAGDPYANCDGSTTQPVLNVLDFACFLNQYAAGCS